jgi:classical protein kinase C
MSSEDEVVRDIHKRIEREKALITAANAMRQSTDNPAVLSGLDTKIRDGRRNIEYFEGRLRELEMRKLGTGMDNLNLDSNTNGRSPAGQAGYGRGGSDGRGPFLPSGEYGDSGQDYSQLSGGNVIMPPSAPFARPGPASSMPRGRPNYSRLGALPRYNQEA